MKDQHLPEKLLNRLTSFSFFIFVTSPIWLSFIRKGQAPWFNYASPVPLHQLNLILEFRKIKNFPSAKWTNWKYELKNKWWSNSNWWHRCKKWDFLEQEKRLWGNKFRCRKVFALNINIFQGESLLMYFDIIPCFLYLGITEMAEEW